MPLIKRVAHAVLWSLMLISILTGCTTTMDSGGIDGPAGGADVRAVACGAFQPIAWSSHDTDATIRQIKQHNAGYAALCSARARK